MWFQCGGRVLFASSLFLVLCLLCPGGVRALPPGFRDEGVVSEKQTVGFNFVPMPAYSLSESQDKEQWILLTTRKKGQIVAVIDPELPDNQSKSYVILNIKDETCTSGERGAFQVLPHPNFRKNRFLYVFFTYDKYGGCKFSATVGPVNAVARYTLETNSTTSKLQMVDETIIFESNPLPSKVHNGGDMKFGNDGYLYITLGNGGLSSQHDNAQKAHTLLGSIIRITDDGGIPPDNPFVDEFDEPCSGTHADKNGTLSDNDTYKGRCSEIYATGFRNPYRFALDPTTLGTKLTRFFVNDVGGSFFEEVNLVQSESKFGGGLNYGYREREGPCYRMTTDDCEPQEGYVDPIFWYEHVNRTDAALTGGTFCPFGVWPPQYDGKYLFADFVLRTISLMEHDPTKACRDCIPPIPAYQGNLFANMTDIGQPLQLTFGPYKDTQALYYSLWAPNDQFSIRRIIYEGKIPDTKPSKIEQHNDENIVDEEEEEAEDNNNDLDEWKDGEENEKKEEEKEKNEEERLKEEQEDTSPPVVNSAPDAVIRANSAEIEKGQNFAINEVIVFDATESSDPDGDDLTYSWNFGDGSGSTKESQFHKFTEPGEYRVKLIVQDNHGSIDTTSRLITVGILPEPEIVVPWDAFRFAVGDVLYLFGAAKDRDGNYLKDEYLTWEVQQVHNTHYHPFLDPTPGNALRAPHAPAPEDFLASTNSYLRVLLTARDPATNLTATVTRDVMPKTRTLYFETDPPGLELTLDGYDIKTPDNVGEVLEVVTWVRHSFSIDVRDQGEMVFDSWSDGTTERHSITKIEDISDGDAIKPNGKSIEIKTARFVESK